VSAVNELGDLLKDGDLLKLDNGRTLRLRMEPDFDASINDYDSDGTVEWTHNDWNGWNHRPALFTGRARKLETEHGSSLWWEPCADLTEEQITAEFPLIRALARFGFQRVILELLDGTDAYGRPIVVQVASLSGIEWDADDGYIQDVVADLLSELEVEGVEFPVPTPTCLHGGPLCADYRAGLHCPCFATLEGRG
jgi:hypothetical protein